MPDYEKVGEVYDSSDDGGAFKTPMDKAYTDLNVAIVALDWYSKNAFTDNTDFRGIAQEALRKIYKRKG